MMIRKRKSEKANGTLSENKSLLDYMIEISENNPDFTEDDIIDEACTFMLAVSDDFLPIHYFLKNITKLRNAITFSRAKIQSARVLLLHYFYSHNTKITRTNVLKS